VRESAFIEGERMQGSARGRLGNWPFYLDAGDMMSYKGVFDEEEILSQT
jgi:hypothetical protein